MNSVLIPRIKRGYHLLEKYYFFFFIVYPVVFRSRLPKRFDSVGPSPKW